MCGIVGVITKLENGFTQPQLDAFEYLLYLDVVRGEDSTGVFSVSNLGNVDIVKGARHGADFIRSEEWEKQKRGAWSNGKILIGHNRKATRGTVVDENAHPFWVEDKIVLVHNGTMYGNHKEHADVEVDSHAIAHLLAEAKDNESIEAALNKINAAYALVWYDVENKKLRFLRNEERPLHWVEMDNCWLIASEKEMLEFVGKRFNLASAKRKWTVYEFPEHNMSTFSLEANNMADAIDLKISSPVRYSYGVTGGGACASPFPVTTTTAQSSNSGKGASENNTNTTKSPWDWANEPIKPWMQQITYAAWNYQKTNVFASGSKIRVEVDDVTQCGQDYVMSGQTLMGEKVLVKFIVDQQTVNRLTSPGTDTVVFEVEVDVYAWIRAKDCSATTFQEHKGYTFIRGKNPHILYVGDTLYA